MSKYTTEVRYICEMKSGIPEELIDKYTVDEIIEKSRLNIFNFDYPIYDSSYRATLEKKILRHYYTREICAETVGLWQLWLNAKLNNIMPKYNKLYQYEKELLNKLMNNIDVTTNHLRTDDLLHEADYRRTDNLTEKFDGERNDINKRRYSDTPQGSISFADADSGNVWLTEYERVDDNIIDDNTRKNTGTQDNVGTDVNTGTQKNDTVEKGYRGSRAYYELLNDYASKVVNIDLMIINELSDLIFGLW